MSEGAKWCLMVSEDAYGCLKVPTGVYEKILVSEGAKWCLRVSMDAYWCLRVPTGV